MFVQTYFNENVCQNITRAKQLFFPDDIKPKQFRVSYLTSDASADCKDGRNIINGTGQGSGQEDICAVITGGNCDATPAELYVVVNYKALEFVSIDIILQAVLLLINVCRCVTPLISAKESQELYMFPKLKNQIQTMANHLSVNINTVFN